MRFLVIGSCTDRKNDEGCAPLTVADFADPKRLSRREEELAPWRQTAADLYRGEQHLEMMKGVGVLRAAFGSGCCELSIISAGYGLLDERKRIVPYNVTFHGEPTAVIRERAE